MLLRMELQHCPEKKDKDEIAKLEAGIKEYHKLRGRVQREQANKQIEDQYL